VSLNSRLESNKEESRPGGNPGANLQSISHRCYLREEAFEWKLTKDTIYLPLGCLQGGRDLKEVELARGRAHIRVLKQRLEQTSSNHAKEICSGSAAGSYLKLINFCIMRVIKKREDTSSKSSCPAAART